MHRVACISVFGGETNATAGDRRRLGQVPYKIVAIPDRVPFRLGLCLLPSARIHLNRPPPPFPLRNDNTDDTTQLIRRDDIQYEMARTLSHLRLHVYITPNIILNFWYYVFTR